MTLTGKPKQEIVGAHGRSANTGSTEVQVALLLRIEELTEHLRTHKEGSPFAARPCSSSSASGGGLLNYLPEEEPGGLRT